MSSEREPTPDELLAMAYMDGELGPGERAAFEARLSNEPLLAREVADLRRLELAARLAAPPEPADAEWRRLARDPLQRLLGFAGWALVLGCAGLLVGSLLYAGLDSAPGWLPRLSIGGLALGAALLVLAAARARWRTRLYDPYTAVKR